MGTWPTDPAAPLVLGGVQGGFDQAIAATPDGALWIAWIDTECFGSLRVQRVDAQGALLKPGAFALDTRNDCMSRAARLAACADGSVVVSGVVGHPNGAAPLDETPVQRIGPDGSSMWGNGIIVAETGSGKVGGFLGLSAGDVLIAWNVGSIVFVGRFAVDGSPVWSQPASVPVPHGPTMRIFAVVTDGADGAFLLWDTPGPYTRAIFAARVTAAGVAAWDEPLQIAPTPGSSMHTDPVAIADGIGGVVVLWTQGNEQAQAIVPMFMQRITADGSLTFGPQGQRISLQQTRQFDPRISRDAISGDVFIAWRDGVFSQTLRVQRMTLTGERIWGDSGVPVTSMGTSSYFDAIWNAKTFAIMLADPSTRRDEPRVNVHHTDGAGVVAPDVWPVSGTEPAAAVHGAAIGEALAVTWFADPPGFDDLVVGQRINADGTLGLPPAVGDLNGDGLVNIDDLFAVISAWGPCSPPCPEDIDGDGNVDIDDLFIVLANWS